MRVGAAEPAEASAEVLPTGRSDAALIRPSVPPLAWFAVAIAYGVILAEECGWRGVAAMTPRLLTQLVAAATVAAVLSALPRARPLLLLIVAGLAAGCVAGTLAWRDTQALAGQVGSAHATRLSVAVVTDPTASSFGESSLSRILSPTSLRGAVVRARWPSGSPAPEAGQRVDVIGTLKPPMPAERLRSELRAGVCGSLSVRAVQHARPASSLRGAFLPLRTWALRRLARIGGPGGDLLSGILVGDRRRLAGTTADEAFRTTGLTHLVAVSGSHLVVVAALVGAACTTLGLKRAAQSALVLGTVAAYVVLSGVQVSAVRALIMSAVTFCRPYSGRRGDSAAAVALTAVLMLLLDPHAAFDLGFQLSVGAVAGLVLFGRLFERWVQAALPRVTGFASGPLALTFAAQALTLPLVVRTFGVLSLVSPIANVLVGPLVAAALVAGVLGLLVSAVWTWLGLQCLGLAGGLCSFSADIASRLASLPGAAILADRSVLVLTGHLRGDPPRHLVCVASPEGTHASGCGASLHLDRCATGVRVANTFDAYAHRARRRPRGCDPRP